MSRAVWLEKIDDYNISELQNKFEHCFFVEKCILLERKQEVIFIRITNDFIYNSLLNNAKIKL